MHELQQYVRRVRVFIEDTTYSIDLTYYNVCNLLIVIVSVYCEHKTRLETIRDSVLTGLMHLACSIRRAA